MCWAETERCSPLPAPWPVPGTLILGVNLGTLGFLTEVQLAGLYPALDSIENGQYIVDTRSMLSCSLIRNGFDADDAPCT